MDSKDVIVNIKSIKDIENITSNTKYINISIDGVSNDVIDYFLLNGKDYSFSDSIEGRNGFIYASYDMFKEGESTIDDIIDSMPTGLSDLEKVRYIYISLGKILCSDINSMNNKNETVSFNRISTINNIWGALSKRKVGDVAVCKIFMYICYRIGIKCELVSASLKGNIANKVYLDDSYLIVDLPSDIHNIQGSFVTRYFDKYNENKDMDRKISYIKDEYMNVYIDNALKNVDYARHNVMEEILSVTSKIINVNNIGPCELFKIYRNIFDRYTPNYDVRINNLFVYNGFDTKDHFVVFSYNGSYYSYNYNKGIFMNMDYSVLCDNINSNRIGIYSDEDFELKEKRVVL